MKQFKLRIIQAMADTRRKYLEPYGKCFFITSDCAICRLVFDKIQKEKPRPWLAGTHHCHFCPMCPIDLHYSEGAGCVRQKTYKMANDWYFDVCDWVNPVRQKDPPPAFIARAESLKKMIDFMKGLPLERFHVDTWTPFGFPEDI